MPELTLESLARRLDEVERRLNERQPSIIAPTKDWQSVVGISEMTEFSHFFASGNGCSIRGGSAGRISRGCSLFRFDANHVSILKMPPSQRRTRLVDRVAQERHEVYGVPIVVVEETMRGWLAAHSALKAPFIFERPFSGLGESCNCLPGAFAPGYWLPPLWG